MLHGGNPYSVRLPTILAPADTPTWMLCFQPLAGAFSLRTASWIWFWINVAALGLILWLLVREASFRGSEAVVVGAVALMYPPLASNLWFGQSEIFLCLLLVLMLIALRRHNDRLAGLVLAAAALLRAYPIGLVAYLLTLRRWKALGWAVGGTIVGGLLTIWFDGWSVVATYIELIGLSRGIGMLGLNSTMTVATGLMKHPANLDLAAFVRWLYDRTASHPVPVAVSIAAVLAEIGAVAACFYATAGIDPDDPDWRGFGLWIVTLSWR
jgi:hypothetical protein